MAFGPELVFAQALEISCEFAQNRVKRAIAGDCWVVLEFSRDRSLLFSWDSEHYGVCRTMPGEIRELEGASSSRPTLLDAVRAHIVGADLSGAAQINRDRVMKIEFRRVIGAGFFQTRFVLFEACGRYSNMIILDEDERVIEAAKHIMPDSNRYRSVIPGHRYAAPPEVGATPIDEFDPAQGRACDIDALRGLGKPLIEAIKQLPPSDAAECLDYLKKMEGMSVLQVYPASGNYVTSCPQMLPGARALADRDALSAARHVVARPLMGRRVAACRKKISSRLDAMERANDKKIAEYSSLASGAGEVEQLKLEGQLILANAHAIPSRAAWAILADWTAEGPVERRVALDPAKNASANAEARFVKYRRKKSALRVASSILSELYIKREEIKEQRVLLACNDDWNCMSMMLEELGAGAPQTALKPGAGKKPAHIPPHKRVELPLSGAIIFCGLSARGNRYVTFKLANGDDLWFHVQGTPGAHVILRFGEKPDGESREQMIEIAASCAAYHSACRDGGRVRVDYTERKHVRPIRGEGPANVTYKEFGTVIADDRLWRESESQEGSLSDRRG
ncbi:MAG: NFACT family protein [Synergistaceae bacterium]|nr:NFACT family protein [Synergistaceae bacterium]